MVLCNQEFIQPTKSSHNLIQTKGQSPDTKMSEEPGVRMSCGSCKHEYCGADKKEGYDLYVYLRCGSNSYYCDSDSGVTKDQFFRRMKNQ